MSPGYPSNYLRSVFCRWIIKAKDDTKRIKLTFEFLDIEQHPSCQYDYLIIRSEQTDDESMMLCGSKKPNTVYGKSFVIEFNSDEEIVRKGFKFNWSVVHEYEEDALPLKTKIAGNVSRRNVLYCHYISIIFIIFCLFHLGSAEFCCNVMVFRYKTRLRKKTMVRL